MEIKERVNALEFVLKNYKPNGKLVFIDRDFVESVQRNGVFENARELLAGLDRFVKEKPKAGNEINLWGTPCLYAEAVAKQLEYSWEKVPQNVGLFLKKCLAVIEKKEE